jgi:hypothetical protein
MSTDAFARRVKRARIVLLVLVAACSAQHIVFQPTAEEQVILAQPPLPLSVAVIVDGRLL